MDSQRNELLADTCRLCGKEANVAFRKFVLGHHKVAYFHCTECGYSQTERPTWLREAYGSAVAEIDTGVLTRNRASADLVGTFLFLVGRQRQPGLDFAGGYGVFTRMMRDLGFDFYHYDPKATNLLARGFEVGNLGIKPEVCTAFEVLEHLVDPIRDLQPLIQYRPTYLITSTEVVQPPLMKDWWYLAPESGQHVGFFESRTLRRLGKALDYPHAIIGSRYQIFGRKPIPKLSWWTANHFGKAALPLLRQTLTPKTDADSEAIKTNLRASWPVDLDG